MWNGLKKIAEYTVNTPTPTVTYVLVNNLGGITSLISNLINYRHAVALPQEAVVLNIKENTAAPMADDFGKDIAVQYFSYSKKENWYYVFGKLAKMIGDTTGVLVANDVFEMLMLQAYDINKKVVQIVHDAYNVQLAIMYGDVVDKFICHSFFYYEVLCQLLPPRKNDIVYMPYGIPLSGKKRPAYKPGSPLKLVFLGRHDKQKGVFDLIEINNIIERSGVQAQWLIMGRGPETEKLKIQWQGKSNVTFYSPATPQGVFEALLAADLMVFPTKFEGFPVALLEAMSAGVVPVASDLPGGLRELVKNEVNGFLCAVDDNNCFAEKIIRLWNDTALLEKMSANAFDEVNTHYNAAVQSPMYQEFFKKVALDQSPPLHHSVNKKIGSRLDQRWIPNTVTKLLRRQYF
jgi:glycosyltransferase involved in cell wall biosynthesis